LLSKFISYVVFYNNILSEPVNRPPDSIIKIDEKVDEWVKKRYDDLESQRMDYYLKYMRNIKPIAGPDDDGFVFIGDGND